MAGFYNVPFSSVAKKPVIEGVLVNTTPNQSESFMDVAKAIRFCTYKYMKVEPESCEVLPMGENKEIDKDVNTYLIHQKGMTRKNDLRKQKYVARFSRRCWQLVLDIEDGVISGSSGSRSAPPINTYFFKWLNASTLEEEIYRTLLRLQAGEVSVKDLAKREKSLSVAEPEEDGDRSMTEWENERKILMNQVEELLTNLKTEKELNRANAEMRKEKELELKVKIRTLEKEAQDSRETVARIRIALSHRISECQSLKAEMEEQLQRKDTKIASLSKENEDLRWELLRWKTSYVQNDTFGDEAGPLTEAYNLEADEVQEQNNQRAVKTSVTKKTVQSTSKIVRNVEVANGASLHMETEVYDDPSSEISEKVRSYLTRPYEKAAAPPIPSSAQNGTTQSSASANASDDNVDQHELSLRNDGHDCDGIEGNEDSQGVEEMDLTGSNLSFGGEEKMDFEQEEMSSIVDSAAMGEGRNEREVRITKETERSAETKETRSDEWVAVTYGRDLLYFGRVVRENDETMAVIFLERRAGGHFQLKKQEEQVEKRLIFKRNVVVNWTGVGRFQVPQEKDLRKENADFMKTSCIRDKLETYWKTEDLSIFSKAVCRVGAQKILLADIKTIQPSMTKKEVSAMKEFSPHFKEVGWLNDTIINASLKLIEASSRTKNLKVLAAESFVLEKILKTELKELKSWKWMKKVNFRNQDIVLMPMCNGSHWTLGVVNFKQKHLLHYDSMSNDKERMSSSGEIFFDSIRKLMKAQKMEVASWKTIEPPTPQQQDARSCGVYVIKVAEFVVEGREPQISQEEVISARLQIAMNLLKTSR